MGFKLNILMFIICLTGAFAVISEELDWLLIANMRVEPQQADYAWQAMLDNAKKQHPNSIISGINGPRYSNFAAIAQAIHPQLGIQRLLFNPYTGELLESRHWYASAQRILRDVHRHLLYPAFGLYIVGFFAFVLLGLVISSLFVYKKWWRNFFSLRRDKGLRILLGDLHKLMGIWALWFLLIIAITGCWYLIEALLSDAGVDIQMDRPKVSKLYLEQAGPVPSIISLNDALKITAREMPGLEITRVSVPVRIDDPYYIEGKGSAWWVRDRANHVFINPFNGKVLKKQMASDQNALSHWIDMADPLHFGSFGGLAIKIIWFVFGLSLPLMSASGTWLWMRRTRRLSKRRQKRTTDIMSSSSAVRLKRKYRLWIFKPVSIAVIAIGLTAGTLVQIYFPYMAGSPDSVQTLAQQQLGPWQVRLQSNIPSQQQQPDRFMLYFECPDCMSNFEQASLAVGTDSGDSELEFISFKRGYTPYMGALSVKLPEGKPVKSMVTIKVEDKNNNSYQASFSLHPDSLVSMELLTD